VFETSSLSRGILPSQCRPADLQRKGSKASNRHNPVPTLIDHLTDHVVYPHESRFQTVHLSDRVESLAAGRHAGSYQQLPRFFRKLHLTIELLPQALQRKDRHNLPLEDDCAVSVVKTTACSCGRSQKTNARLENRSECTSPRLAVVEVEALWTRRFTVPCKSGMTDKTRSWNLATWSDN